MPVGVRKQTSQRSITINPHSFPEFEGNINIENFPTEFGGGINAEYFNIGSPRLRTSWTIQTVTVQVKRIEWSNINGTSAGTIKPILEISLLVGTNPVVVNTLSFPITLEERLKGAVTVSKEKVIVLELYQSVTISRSEQLGIEFKLPRRDPSPEGGLKAWGWKIEKPVVTALFSQEFPVGAGT